MKMARFGPDFQSEKPKVIQKLVLSKLPLTIFDVIKNFLMKIWIIFYPVNVELYSCSGCSCSFDVLEIACYGPNRQLEKYKPGALKRVVCANFTLLF